MFFAFGLSLTLKQTLVLILQQLQQLTYISAGTKAINKEMDYTNRTNSTQIMTEKITFTVNLKMDLFKKKYI